MQEATHEYLHWPQVVEASLQLLEDESAYGKILMVHVNGKFFEWTPPKGNLKQSTPSSASGTLQASCKSWVLLVSQQPKQG